MLAGEEIGLLSARQREVLELIARGLSNDDIGAALGVSPGTVRTHVTAILATLDVLNRTEAAAAWVAWSAKPAHVEEVLARPAIAVLPFAALDDSGRTRTVAAGLSEDLASLFARWCWFPVISTQSVAASRAPEDTAAVLGEKLGARFLVEGSLGPRGHGAWRVTARVEDARDAHCLWTERYDFSAEELLAVEDEISERIVAASYPVMLAHLAPSRAGRMLEDLTPWELAHEGMALEAIRDARNNAEAQARFVRAITLAPALVLGHFGLGLASYDEVLNQWGPNDAGIRRLTTCAERCIELAPHAAEGHFLLGRRHQTHGDHALAAAALETAIARNPSFAAAHALLAQTLVLTGKYDEGLARMRHAVRLGPRSYVAGLGVVHFVRAEYAEALAAAESALSTRPDYPFGHVLAAASAFWLADGAKAARHVRALRRVAPSYAPVTFLRTFGAGVDGVERVTRALDALGIGR